MTPFPVMLVVGARPNFMKAAPLLEELLRFRDIFSPLLVHTGQHYDHNLSQLFFEDLQLPQPDFYLGVGSDSHAKQTAHIMIKLEQVMSEQHPKLVIVFGDVNSTVAAALVTAKLGIPLAHVEAGLRSFDRAMPEEINRVVTDCLSEYLFVTEQVGVDNLRREGVHDDHIFLVGNLMVDALKRFLPLAEQSGIINRLELVPGTYGVLTLHRSANVDNAERLHSIWETIQQVGSMVPLVFPCHPRTRKRFAQFGVEHANLENHIQIIDPLGYLDFLQLIKSSAFVLTDSGGIQSETTFLNVPCLTMRTVTEQPATVSSGTNVLCGTVTDVILSCVREILSGNGKQGKTPPLWDGNTASRIVAILSDKLE